MNCTACGSENLPGRRYCGGCGQPLFLFCPFCGFGNSEIDRFCGGCGRGKQEAISDSQPVPKNSQISSRRRHFPKDQSELSEAMINELLEAKDAFQGLEETGKKSEKSVSQDEIDKILKKGS